MSLFELCLLSVLSPQSPEATAATPTVEKVAPQSPGATVAEPEKQDPVDPRTRLQAAENAGSNADTDELIALTECEDASVAARAAWLMAHSDNPEHARALPPVAVKSPHADARVQAMKFLFTKGQPSSAGVAVKGLADADRRVRTLAVQLLGKIRNPLAIDVLVTLIDDYANDEQPGAATDIQAALLTLTDFEATDQLLRIATSIQDGKVAETGTALTYAFQTLSPKMEAEQETTLLVAVLDHREVNLRRYAITRLAELGSTSAVSALEGRLANEGPELRPLVENALAQIRHEHQAPPGTEMERAQNNARVLMARLSSWWNNLEPLHQGLVAGAPVLLIVLIWMMRRRSKRRAAHEEAVAAAAMVQPSDEYYEDDEYDEEGEYEDDEDAEEFEEEYEDGNYEESYAEEDGDYDTSGWDEGAEDETLLAEGGLDDDRFR